MQTAITGHVGGYSSPNMGKADVVFGSRFLGPNPTPRRRGGIGTPTGR
jgi:hypothetical protein